MATIAVIGAAGFVGMELVSALEERGHTVIAVARSNGKFLLQRNKCVVIHPSDVHRRDDIDIVVNLAYPNSGSVHHYPERNKELLTMIGLLAGDRARIIHTSTIAVFGFQLEQEIKPAPVANRRDYLYVESKIELENMLLNTFAHERLAIVRLGNVWGRRSAAWTAPLINNLLFGIPVGVADEDGYSNVTDVANVVSYIAFLAEKKSPSSMLFHHLAEFSGVRWSAWIKRINSVLRTTAVTIDRPPHYPMSAAEEFKKIFSPIKPRTVYKKMVYGRFTGSLMHSIIGLLPESYFTKKKQQNIQALPERKRYADSDEVFLWVMSCSKEFVSVTEPVWTPAVSQDGSWERIAAWMQEIGYPTGVRNE